VTSLPLLETLKANGAKNGSKKFKRPNCIDGKLKKISFIHLPQSQNKNINNMCIVGNPVRMISEQGGVKILALIM
jgi:hypothetical protein